VTTPLLSPGYETGLRYGDRVRIEVKTDDGLLVATATYSGYAGGPTAQVKLDGTEELVQVPRAWIRKETS
jgi:hypothetical protein